MSHHFNQQWANVKQGLTLGVPGQPTTGNVTPPNGFATGMSRTNVVIQLDMMMIDLISSSFFTLYFEIINNNSRVRYNIIKNMIDSSSNDNNK